MCLNPVISELNVYLWCLFRQELCFFSSCLYTIEHRHSNNLRQDFLSLLSLASPSIPCPHSWEEPPLILVAWVIFLSFFFFCWDLFVVGWVFQLKTSIEWGGQSLAMSSPHSGEEPPFILVPELLCFLFSETSSSLLEFLMGWGNQSHASSSKLPLMTCMVVTMLIMPCFSSIPH